MQFDLPQQPRDLPPSIRAGLEGRDDAKRRYSFIDETLKRILLELPADSDLGDLIVGIRGELRGFLVDPASETAEGFEDCWRDIALSLSQHSEEALNRFAEIFNDAAKRISREYSDGAQGAPVRLSLGSFRGPSAAADISQALGRALGIEDRSRWLTVTEAAKYLRLKTYEVTRMANNGVLRTNGESGRDRRLDPASIIRWQQR